MSGGILGGGLPLGGGLLGGFEDYARNNQASLLGMAAGLMSGDMSAGLQGYAQGSVQDQRTRLLRLKEAEDAQRKTEALKLAQSLKLPPSLASDPDTVFAIARQQYTPKELSFEEQQFRQLSPEQQAQYRQQKFLGNGTNVGAQIEERKRLAPSIGLTPEHPAYQSWVATGKMPREDQAPLTATDKKAILEADEGVEAATNAIDALEKAKQLSAQAYEGFTAGPRSAVTGMWGNEGGVATQELDNLVGTNALSQLKAIFGGNPTEGERAIMMELQGSSSKPHEVRVKIYERAQEMARRRLAFNKQRADALRGGSFYGGQGRAPAQGQQTQQPSAQGAVTVDGYTIRQR